MGIGHLLVMLGATGLFACVEPGDSLVDDDLAVAADLDADAGVPGPLTIARTCHSATLLASGAVLFAGGMDRAVVHASSEVYRNGDTTPTGAMHQARCAHLATRLRSGAVLAVGGLGGGVTALTTAELYDPATGTWARTGSTHVARWEFTATLLPSGKVLIVGGISDWNNAAPRPHGTAELYDPATGTWSLTSPLNIARHGHTATLLASGRVLVTGGVDPGYARSQTAELYDPSTGKWSMTGSMAHRRSRHTATMLPSGKVLIATHGGLRPAGESASAELYDPRTGAFAAAAVPLHQHVNGVAAALPSGHVLLVGGGGAFDQAGWWTELPLVDRYDPATDRWTAVAPLTTGRTFHTVTALATGQVVVSGGGNGLASVEIFDPAMEMWLSSPAP